jgi:hypothetical protein
MSLNRYEQALFDYWEKQPDEKRHWQAKVIELTETPASTAGATARGLERELWEHLIERSQHVRILRDLRLDEVSRVSLLNLAEHVIRLWGPPPKPRRPTASG